LVFTGYQVYFECHDMQCCEVVSKLLAPLAIKDRQRLESLRLFPHNGLSENPWNIATPIAEYSRRELTYNSDVLNAMLSVFRDFETIKDPAYYYWGVPILTPSMEPIEIVNGVYGGGTDWRL
ncbi:hypothetical protein K432DRAFT_293588, partial [Lepidopterella palustris CBS 459.81]